MNRMIKVLKDNGCDMDSSLRRLRGNDTFLIKCARKAVIDEDFEALGVAINERDIDSAFKCAHALKGILLNVGLTPLYDKVFIIVEKLRKGRWNDEVLEDYVRLQECRTKFCELLKEG